ncbi:MAG TPA: hypothetical protein VGI87_16395 [Solirubrobacteraceae bacterium]|jgi:hypothetical protein
MHDQPEREERSKGPEDEERDQDPAPTQASDAERVTGEQSAELEDEPGSASRDPQRQSD